MKLDVQHTALLITDPQKDVLSPDGLLADLLHEQVAQRHVVENLVSLRDHAQRVGMPVLYSTLEQNPKNVATPPTNSPIYALIHERKAMRPGAGGDVIAALAPNDATTLVYPRSGMMAFGVTDLDQLLRARGIKTLIMGGMVLNLCVESNVRGAVEHGYEVILVSDASATVSDAAHEGTLASLSLIAQHIATTDEVIGALTQLSA